MSDRPPSALALHLVDAMVHRSQHGLHRCEAHDEETDDGVVYVELVVWFYGDVDAEGRADEGEEVGEGLRGGVDMDGISG